MNYYKLRVDTDSIAHVKPILMKYTDRWLVCIENIGEENTHCHAYLETNTKEATLRNVLRKKFGSGNGVYSMKNLSEQYPIEYLAYCIKEKNYEHTLPNEIILKAIEHDKKVKEEIKEKKKSRRTILEKLEEYIDFPNNPTLDTCTIVSKVVDYYKETGTLVREFALISQVQTLLLKHTDDYASTLEMNIHRAIDKSKIN